MDGLKEIVTDFKERVDTAYNERNVKFGKGKFAPFLDCLKGFIRQSFFISLILLINYTFYNININSFSIINQFVGLIVFLFSSLFIFTLFYLDYYFISNILKDRT